MPELTLRKTNLCEACCEPPSGFNDTQTNGVMCGREAEKCPHCSLDAGTCAEHLLECPLRGCDFAGCEDCVSEHEQFCGKPQPIIDALDNPCAVELL